MREVAVDGRKTGRDQSFIMFKTFADVGACEVAVDNVPDEVRAMKKTHHFDPKMIDGLREGRGI